jgi:hypothetical protein
MKIYGYLIWRSMAILYEDLWLSYMKIYAILYEDLWLSYMKIYGSLIWRSMAILYEDLWLSYMKIYVLHFVSYLAHFLLEWKMFQTKL